MDDGYVTRGRSRRGAQRITNFHHYHVELFVAIVDKQLVELNSCFDEVNTKLRLCFASLSPDDLFSAFDEQKLICFAQFYPNEFTTYQLLALEDQVGHYILCIYNATFSKYENASGTIVLVAEFSYRRELLANLRVDNYHQWYNSHLILLYCTYALSSRVGQHSLIWSPNGHPGSGCVRNRVHNHVYLLIALALVLPVATVLVERACSAINIVKTLLRNRMGDQWLSDIMVVYIESNFLSSIDNEAIMRHFQNMKTRRELL
ncbi:hypothetical protein DVH24_002844 [Malus domestica]|uniref:HAT C-terminal dimerisation domain-containing protein n=1 Tax=Malus domestica TaxID=3750 RepID=A0A498K5W0_MALDO|nr:hypothetical protein DVH24_002844 [Malus domestica]